MSNGKMKIVKPKECEKILNYNGFYAQRQSGSHVIFKDDLGRHICIPRGSVNPCIWRRLVKENSLVAPSKAFR